MTHGPPSENAVLNTNELLQNVPRPTLEHVGARPVTRETDAGDGENGKRS